MQARGCQKFSETRVSLDIWHINRAVCKGVDLYRNYMHFKRRNIRRKLPVPSLRKVSNPLCTFLPHVQAVACAFLERVADYTYTESLL